MKKEYKKDCFRSLFFCFFSKKKRKKRRRRATSLHNSNKKRGITTVHNDGNGRSRKELDEIEGMVENMVENGDEDGEPAFNLKEIQSILEALERARHLLEMLLRGERCPLCGVVHNWNGRTLWYASTLVKMRALGETETVFYLEFALSDEGALRKAGFTSRTQAQRLLARFTDLLDWAGE